MINRIEPVSVLILIIPLILNSEIETGACPPRAQFSAPSRKIRAHRNIPSLIGSFTRNKLFARARTATPGAGVLPKFGFGLILSKPLPK